MGTPLYDSPVKIWSLKTIRLLRIICMWYSWGKDLWRWFFPLWTENESIISVYTLQFICWYFLAVSSIHMPSGVSSTSALNYFKTHSITWLSKGGCWKSFTWTITPSQVHLNDFFSFQKNVPILFRHLILVEITNIFLILILFFDKSNLLL